MPKTLDVGVGGIEGIDNAKGCKARIKTKSSAVPPREGPRRGKNYVGVIGIILDSDLPQDLILVYRTSKPFNFSASGLPLPISLSRSQSHSNPSLGPWSSCLAFVVSLAS